MRSPVSARFASLALVASLVLAALACGTDPVGVEACQKIEKVRCESAQACGISLARPVHEGETPERNVAACTRYYEDQCLHGMAIAKAPSSQDVDRCVDAIIQGACTVVEAPETHPSCAFLAPPSAPPTTDAGADAEPDAAVTDAGATDATTN